MPSSVVFYKTHRVDFWTKTLQKQNYVKTFFETYLLDYGQTVYKVKILYQLNRKLYDLIIYDIMGNKLHTVNHSSLYVSEMYDDKFKGLHFSELRRHKSSDIGQRLLRTLLARTMRTKNNKN